MKFSIAFFVVFVAYVQAYVAFDRSAVEHSGLPLLTSYPVELRYDGLDHLGYSAYHNQDIIGQYNFGYDTINNKRAEARDAFGHVVGSYTYVDAEGKVQTMNYRADERGFNVAGTIIPDASSVVADLKPVEETEEVKLAREAHLKAYEDFVAGKYELPVAPEVPVAVVPEVPVVPELKTIEDEPEVALAKKEFLDKYDATVTLLKKIESGEIEVTTPATVELPEPVTDEPLVSKAKKEHNEYREALKEQYETLEKLAISPIVPLVRDAGIIPTPIVTMEGQIHEALITPTLLPEVKSMITEEKLHETLIPASRILPLTQSTSFVAPSLKSIFPIVTEGKVHEALTMPTYPSLPLISSPYIAPELKSVSPIVTEEKVHEPLIMPTFPSLPLVSSPYIAPELKSISPIVTEEKVHEKIFWPPYPSFPLVSSSLITPAVKSMSPIITEESLRESLIAPAYPSLPLISSSYIAPELKSVSPIVAEGKVHEPLITSYLPHALTLEGNRYLPYVL